MSEQQKAIIKALGHTIISVQKHGSLIESLCVAASDHVIAIEMSLERCQNESCTRAAVVINEAITAVRCDRCAAEMIYNAKKNFIGDTNDPIDVARSIASDESQWHDIRNADSIRRICDHVEVIKDSELVMPVIH